MIKKLNLILALCALLITLLSGSVVAQMNGLPGNDFVANARLGFLQGNPQTLLSVYHDHPVDDYPEAEGNLSVGWNFFGNFRRVPFVPLDNNLQKDYTAAMKQSNLLQTSLTCGPTYSSHYNLIHIGAGLGGTGEGFGPALTAKFQVVSPDEVWVLSGSTNYVRVVDNMVAKPNAFYYETKALGKVSGFRSSDPMEMYAGVMSVSNLMDAGGILQWNLYPQRYDRGMICSFYCSVGFKWGSTASTGNWSGMFGVAFTFSSDPDGDRPLLYQGGNTGKDGKMDRSGVPRGKYF